MKDFSGVLSITGSAFKLLINIIDVINKLGYVDVSDKKLIERTEFETNMNKVIKESELFTNPH